MADRTVSIRLLLNTAGFLAGAKVADMQARKLADSISRSAEKRDAINAVGNAFGVVGVAAGAASFIMLKSAADFDAGMSKVQAATRASAEEQKRLRDAALDAGARTVYSATEAASAIENLAKAGVSTADIVGGALDGALDLAAAGGLEVAAAAEIAATAMTQFKLSGEDVPHIADLLAAGAGKAQGEVQDLGLALSYAGVPAANLGVSIEETAGTLALFAKNGIIGERAGTSLRGMLASLGSPSEVAAKEMQRLGISVFDAQGNFIGLDGVAGVLHSRLGGLTQQERQYALGRIFGNEQLQAATTLYREGAAGVDEWTEKVNDQGYAAETAAIRMDNLTGDLEKLKGALETAFIGTGSGAQGPLRDLVQLLAKVVDGYNALPGPIKDMTGATLLAVAAIGGIGFVASRAITGMASMRNNLRTVKTTVTDAGVSLGEMNKKAMLARGGALALAVALPSLLQATGQTSDGMNDLSMVVSGAAAGFAVGGPWGAAIGGAVGILGTFTTGSQDAAAAQAEFDAMVEEVSGTLDEQTGTITENTAAWVRKKLADDGVFDTAEELGLNLGLVTRAAMGQTDAVEQLNRQLDEIARKKGFEGDLELDDETFVSWLSLKKNVNDSSDAIDSAQESARQNRTAQRQQSAAVADGTRKIADQTEALAKNIKQLEKRVVAILENTDKTVAFEAALDASSKALRGNNDSLDLSTKKGRENYAVIRDQIAAALDFKDGTKQQSRAIRDTIDTLLDFRNEARQNGERVPAWIDRQIDKFRQLQREANVALHGIDDEDVGIDLTASASRIAKVEWQLNRAGMATGGAVYGPGTSTSDDIPAWLSTGERVTAARIINAAGNGDNRRGQAMMAAIERMIVRGELGKYGDIPAFANGGAVMPRVQMTGLPGAIADVQAWVDASTMDLSELLSSLISKAISFLPTAGQLGPDGTLTPAQLMRGQTFARGEAGKPYLWTGVGPGGYDCSGFQSAVLNSAMGRYPYSRIGSTGTMPWPGSAAGVGRYTIGWFTGDPGHTSGDIGGLGVESSGGVGVRVGSGARSPLDPMFNGVMHYDNAPNVLPPGWTAAFNGTGRDEYVVKGYAEGGEVTDDKKRPPPGKRPVTEDTIGGIVADIRAVFGDRSPLVDIIRQWLEGLNRSELTTRAFNQRLREVLHRRLDPALRQFNVAPGQTRGETRGELRELLRTLKDTFGPDAPVVDRVERLGDRLLEVQSRQDKVANQYERANDKLAAIVDRQHQFASEVRAAFTHDAFGSEIDTVRDSLIQLRADANDAERATRQFRRLGRKGLDDSIIRQLGASGNTALLRNLSSMTPKEIAEYERAFKRRQQALGQLGQLAGRQVFGDERRDQIRVTNRLERRLGQLDHTLNRLERRVEHGAEKGIRRGMSDIERHQRRRRRAKAVR